MTEKLPDALASLQRIRRQRCALFAEIAKLNQCEGPRLTAIYEAVKARIPRGECSVAFRVGTRCWRVRGPIASAPPSVEEIEDYPDLGAITLDVPG